MRGALFGLGAYAAYAAVVGVLFTILVTGLFDASMPRARAGTPVLPTVQTVISGSARPEVQPASPSPSVIRFIVRTDSGEFTVECHTTADRAAHDVLLVDPGDIGQAYQELGCQ